MLTVGIFAFLFILPLLILQGQRQGLQVETFIHEWRGLFTYVPLWPCVIHCVCLYSVQYAGSPVGTVFVRDLYCCKISGC